MDTGSGFEMKNIENCGILSHTSPWLHNGFPRQRFLCMDADWLRQHMNRRRHHNGRTQHTSDVITLCVPLTVS